MKYLIPVLLLIVVACTSQKKKKELESKVNYIGAPTIVYKTKKDYSGNVPVMLNATKDTIISYPAKEDLKLNGTWAYPSLLHKDFLLDNRGIGPNVAFLKYSYEEYYNLSSIPNEKELMAAIIDKDPLKEMYNLGSRYQYKNVIDSINSLIDNGDIKLHKKIK